MKIELYINGEWKLFTVPFVPMLAKRKYFEILSKAEERTEPATNKELLEEEDSLNAILTDVVFKGQFTLQELYEGNTSDYIKDKFREAVFGEKPKEDVEGNQKGE